MQLSLKQYLAIGFGITALGGYLLHTANPTQVESMATVSGSLEPVAVAPAIPQDHVAMQSTTIPEFQPIQDTIDPVVFEEGDETPEFANNDVTLEGQISILDSDTVNEEIALETDVAAEMVAMEEEVVESQLSDEIMTTANLQAARSEESETQFQLTETEPVAMVTETESQPVETQTEETVTIKDLLAPNQWRANPFFEKGSAQATPPATVEVASETNNEFAAPETDTAGDQLDNVPDTEFTFPEELNRQQPATDLASAPVVADTENQTPTTEASDNEFSTSVMTTDTVRQGVELTSNITPLQMPLSESAAQQAVHHIEYGKSLSRRGAAFAARQEFISALRVIAQQNDARSGGMEFTKSLQRALMAMKEAKDFMVQDEQVMLNVSRVIESHHSEILTQDEAANMTPVMALQKYLATAENGLDMAGGRNVVSAEALYCLGKLHTMMSTSSRKPGGLDLASSVAFHRAALKSDAQNHRSANELGVLMAQSGRLEEAKELFKQSLRIRQSPLTWTNLAKTHQRLGEVQFAQMAERESRIAGTAQVASNASIQWVNNRDFNAMQPSEVMAQPGKTQTIPKVGAQRPQVAEAMQLPGQANPTPQQKSSKGLSKRLRDLF